MFSYLKDSEYSINGEEIDVSERNFKMAVTIENFNGPSKIKNDERYVKWMFRIVGKHEGEYY